MLKPYEYNRTIYIKSGNITRHVYKAGKKPTKVVRYNGLVYRVVHPNGASYLYVLNGVYRGGK